MKYLFALAMSLLAAATSVSADPGANSAVLVATIKKACQDRADAGFFQSVAVASIAPSATSNGENSIYCGEASSAREIYELGSISKSFTGIALARFSIEGLLDLDHPISEYVRELRNTTMGKATLRQLATHTAGLPHDYSGPQSSWEYDEQGLITFLQSYAPQIAAGTRSYSNVGFGTIGLVLSRIAGRPYQQIIQLQVLNELSMNDTEFSTGQVAPRGLLQGYDVLLNPGRMSHLSDLAAAAGGLVSDLHDMMIYLKANLHPDSSLIGQAMTLSQTQGLGWDSLPGKLPTWKNGAMSDGFSSIIELDPSKKTGTVVLANTLNAPTVETLGDIAMGQRDNFQVVRLNSNFLNDVVGHYMTDDGRNALDVSAFHQDFAQARLSNATQAVSFRLLSVSDPMTFEYNDGVDNSNRVIFAIDSQLQQVTATYYRYLRNDASGKPVYSKTLFRRKS
jgi:D-alanyl-D-alanine-carboxypeptidase/D-alanyl-D-alanine-endopeptidase